MVLPFALFSPVLLIPAIDLWLGGGGLASQPLDNSIAIGSLLICAVYLYLSTGRVYGGSGVTRIFKAIVLALAAASIFLVIASCCYGHVVHDLRSRYDSSDPNRCAQRSPIMTTNDQSPWTAEESLKRLKDGNARFVSGQTRFSTLQADDLAELAKGQKPYATILGCSDSRVPPELVFDAGFGELFVVRVAGNTLGPSIAGTLQYASAHLHTPLFVVMGHEGCGAVKAAIDSRFHGAQHKSRIALLLENILPALDNMDEKLAPETLVDAAVEANVRWTMRQLLKSPKRQTGMAQDGIMLVGAVYGLQTGRVRFLE